MFIISHYKSSYDWVKEYTDCFIVYHKDRVNVGYNISSMLTYIIDNYDHLPDVCVFVKDNILERHITKEEFDKVIGFQNDLIPLLTSKHVTDGVINRYNENGVYEERNDSWYFHSYPSKFFKSYKDFAYKMNLPCPEYLTFAPGGNYIVPRNNIKNRSKLFYEQLLEFVSWSQINAESHCVERALYTIWTLQH